MQNGMVCVCSVPWVPGTAPGGCSPHGTGREVHTRRHQPAALLPDVARAGALHQNAARAVPRGRREGHVRQTGMLFWVVSPTNSLPSAGI